MCGERETLKAEGFYGGLAGVNVAGAGKARTAAAASPAWRPRADFNDRHRSGDAAKILDQGFLRVYRYPADRNDSPPPVRD